MNIHNSSMFFYASNIYEHERVIYKSSLLYHGLFDSNKHNSHLPLILLSSTKVYVEDKITFYVIYAYSQSHLPTFSLIIPITLRNNKH